MKKKNLLILLSAFFLASGPLVSTAPAEEGFAETSLSMTKDLTISVLLLNGRHRRIGDKPVLLTMMIEGKVQTAPNFVTNRSGVAEHTFKNIPQEGAWITADYYELNEKIFVEPGESNIVMVLAPNYDPRKNQNRRAQLTHLLGDDL